MKRMKCIKCTVLEIYYGFTINREEDRMYDDDIDEYSGRIKVFYTVNDEDCMLESFKTLKEAKKWIEKIL